MLMLCPLPYSPSSLESGRKGRVYFRHSPRTNPSEEVGIFARNLNHADRNLLETFWRTQV